MHGPLNIKFITTHSNLDSAINILKISEIQLKMPKNAAVARPESRMF